jgi:hypothetical protein
MTMSDLSRRDRAPSRGRVALRAWIAEDPQRARAYIEERVQMVPWSGCWLWERALRSGYGQFTIARGGSQASCTAHVAAYEAFVGPVPGGLLVRHKCDVPACCNPDHLEPGTYVDNMRDCVERERSPRGERNAMSVMTDDLALDIVRLSKAGMKNEAIAARIGVTHQTVSRVLRGNIWRHVTGIPEQPKRPRISRSDVLSIVEARRSGATQSATAASHGVSQALVSLIMLGRAWSDVTGIIPRERTPRGSRSPR